MSYDVLGQIKPPQSMVDVGNHPNVTFSESTYSGYSVYQFTSTTPSLLSAVERGQRTSENLTWESLGVPADADYVSRIRVGVSYWTVNNTGLASHAVAVRLIKDSGVSVSDAILLQYSMTTGVDTMWQEFVAANAITINKAYETVMSTFKLQLGISVNTYSGTVDYRWVCRYVTTQVYYDYYGTEFVVNSLLIWDW